MIGAMESTDEVETVRAVTNDGMAEWNNVGRNKATIMLQIVQKGWIDSKTTVERCNCRKSTVRLIAIRGYLDEQFYHLEELQDDVTPNFVEEVVTLFFKDSSRLLSSIEQALEMSSPDFQKLDSQMHQFKGSISSIGALRVKNVCILLGEYCCNKNLDGCIREFHKVKKEYAILKQKLEAYFQLLRQIGPAEGATKSVK